MTASELSAIYYNKYSREVKCRLTYNFLANMYMENGGEDDNHL